MRLKGVYQHNSKDCGVACLLSIVEYYGGKNDFENIRYLTKCDTNGISALNIVNAASKLGFTARGIKCDLDNIKELCIPLICHVTLNNGYNHYIIIKKIDKNYVYVFDPDKGHERYRVDKFKEIWNGIVIELIPYRKLDVVENKIPNLLKNIFSRNKYLYFMIVILCFISIILAIVNNFYFKILLESKNLLLVFITFLIILFMKEIIGFIRNNLIIKMDNDIDLFLNLDGHKKLLLLPNYYYNSRTIGDIITKIQDISYVKEFFIKILLLIPVNTVLLVVSTLILLNINKKLFLIFVIVVILYVLVMLLFGKKSRKLIRLNQDNKSLNNEILVSNIKNIATIKNLNIESIEHEKYKSNYMKYIFDRNNYERLYLIEQFIKNLILFIGMNLILYFGASYIDKGILEISDLILFNSLILYFIEPLKDLCELNPIVKNGINALKRISEIYGFKKSCYEKIEVSKFDIEFKNLTFSYDGLNNVLNSINLKIKDREKLAVVGPSGCGKSTLFKLLNKTYETLDGTIYVGCVDINNIDIGKYITYVSQEELLFNDTLYNNLVCGSENVCDIDKILKITKMDRVISLKKMSMDSMIFENGENLSKGEKQKLIISRVLLRNSNILILDEALNGMEEAEEVEILKNIMDNFNDKTIIYITHRTKCIKLFDRVINLNEIKEV